MKKLFAVMLALVVALSACALAEDAMSYADYVAAEIDDEVTIEAYVQAHQGWWDNNGTGNVTIYAQDEEGGYFLYNAVATQEEADKLVPGTKIRATGYKAEWSGEVELVDATFEIIEGEYIADPVDVTDLLGTDALIEKQNQKVSFKGMTVEPIGDAGAAWLYGWDGSGEEGSDLYFNVSVNGQTYNFTVESYLCGPGTEVYEAVKALNVGDVIDLEGFLYWYEGVNPHITAVTPAA
jgi:hypothetical protein